MRVAVGQMCSAKSHGPNIETLQEMAASAADRQADLLALPEVAGLMNRNPAEAAKLVQDQRADPFLAACCESAKRHGLWLQPGTVPVRGPGEKFLNHATLIAPDGAVKARYDKAHLFDVALAGQKPIGESKRFAAGDTGVVVQTALAKLGLTICYDLRFPAIFRRYAQMGAQVIFVPSAFTVPTGRAHWEVLLRARAIETGSFIIAAAQSGRHEDGRETWGHSLVVGPWGDVLLDMGQAAPALEVVELDLDQVAQARAQIPSWQLERDLAYRDIDAT